MPRTVIKLSQYKDLIVDSHVDILALTEIWLSIESDEYIIRKVCPTGYEFFHVSRGGGIGLLYKKVICFQKQSCIKAKFKLFEVMDLLVKQGSSSLYCCCLSPAES